MNQKIWKDSVRGAVWALVTGDALGLPVQFRSRESVREKHISGMTSGVFGMPAGSWSDDGSLTLASLDSLSGGWGPEDMMKCFADWLQNGAYTQCGFAYDVGGATMNAINRYLRGAPAEKCGGDGGRDNGNGSLMRILPTSLYVIGNGTWSADRSEALRCVHEASALTHAHPIAMMGCGLYTAVLSALSEAREAGETELPVKAMENAIAACFASYQKGAGNVRGREEYAKHRFSYKRLLDLNAFRALPDAEIRSTGFVVDTLEAALWSLLNTASLRDCLLTAVDFGDDTDSIAAVAGGLAGAWYGEAAIPAEWRGAIRGAELVEEPLRAFLKEFAQ